MYNVILVLITGILLAGCANNGKPVKRSEAASEAADSAVHRVYSDLARAPNIPNTRR